MPVCKCETCGLTQSDRRTRNSKCGRCKGHGKMVRLGRLGNKP